MKGEIDHDLITASTWKDLRNDWLPYLIKDVESLANVWTKYTQSMCGSSISLVYPLVIHKYLSSPSLAWNYLLHTLGDDCSSTFKYFTDKSVWAFVWKSIHGGWCMAYGWKLNENIPLIAFDANSLYPTVMKNIKEFPDIYNSVKIYSDMSYDMIINKYKFYILCCDVYLPHMFFIPVPNKTEGASSCFYNYGHLLN